jgi:sporulation protein YlmC with PRC-barrel domain
MRTKILAALLASVIVAPALAQDRPATRTDTVATTATAQGNVWRASKLVGLNVYNDQNEKLGDISEILMDKSGKVDGVIIGVGGFLGIGQNDIKVEMSKLKFINEPVRTSAATTTTSSSTTADTAAGQRTSTTTGAPANTTTRATDRKWYPDHAVLSGVNKDQLKAMPQFKYD